MSFCIFLDVLSIEYFSGRRVLCRIQTQRWSCHPLHLQLAGWWVPSHAIFYHKLSIYMYTCTSKAMLSSFWLTFYMTGVGHYCWRGIIEDSATAEISRSQIWMWLRHGSHFCDEDQSLITRTKVRTIIYTANNSMKMFTANNINYNPFN